MVLPARLLLPARRADCLARRPPDGSPRRPLGPPVPAYRGPGQALVYPGADRSMWCHGPSQKSGGLGELCRRQQYICESCGSAGERGSFELDVHHSSLASSCHVAASISGCLSRDGKVCGALHTTAVALLLPGGESGSSCSVSKRMV